MELKTLEELLIAGVKHGVSDVHFRPGGLARMVPSPAHPDLSRRPRMRREARTFRAMLDISCRRLHGTAPGELCPACAELHDYALVRLARCPFQEGKTTCAKCRVHCYRPQMRERARETMRTAGPRMPLRHPLMTLRHFLDGFRKEPRRRSRPG